MSLIRIEGGKPLKGRVDLKGAKNLVTKAMVAALLGETPSTLLDVPHISDVEVVERLLNLHGVTITHDPKTGNMTLDPSNVEQARIVDIDAHAGSSRIPILFCGPLLHRLGEAFIPGLGGCEIGDRPVDFHFDVLRQFGAVIEKLPTGTRLSAPDGLVAAKIDLPYPSVGATEQVLLSATTAKGLTELRGAAIEPEIIDLIAILQKMGAIISVDTDRVIRIEGVKQLKGYTHKALFDRNEAASWAAAALATKGDIFVGGAQQIEMMTFLNTYRECLGGNPCRFGQRNFNHSAVISGPTPLRGADIRVPDLRGGFSHVVAALAAEGTSNVSNVQLISRGYERFIDKLQDLGADFQIEG